MDRLSSVFLSCFNPRTHIGCDFYLCCRHIQVGRFQSTHPHRMRPTASLMGVAFACFNPRTHIGCDRDLATICSPLTRFQSTHPHRMRPLARPFFSRYFLFQSTHPHRMRLLHGCQVLLVRRFNPRTHIGCDLRLMQV